MVYITTPAIPSCFVAFSAIPIPILKFPIFNSSSNIDYIHRVEKSKLKVVRYLPYGRVYAATVLYPVDNVLNAFAITY